MKSQLVDRTVECERHLVILFVHRRASVQTNVEGLINRHQKWDRSRHLLGVDDLSIYLQHAGAALRDAGAVVGEVEHDRVLTRGEWLRVLPMELHKFETVVVEYRLALEYVQPKPAEAAALGGNHPIASAVRDVDVRRNRIGLVQDARRVSE